MKALISSVAVLCAVCVGFGCCPKIEPLTPPDGTAAYSCGSGPHFSYDMSPACAKSIKVPITGLCGDSAMVRVVFSDQAGDEESFPTIAFVVGEPGVTVGAMGTGEKRWHLVSIDKEAFWAKARAAIGGNPDTVRETQLRVVIEDLKDGEEKGGGTCRTSGGVQFDINQ